MRASTLLTVSVCLAVQSTVSAADVHFPYEAVVQSDGVIVRSGPGERYDPTLKLSSGQRITVHRHDPGGWFVISPPPGSFSWINASYVETTGDGRGIVRAPDQGNGLPARVVVFIGSQFTNEHKYFGRRLANGDEVTILGEETQQTDRGPVGFYKIQPPRHEYRWVKGDYVVPLSEMGNIAQQPPAKPSPFGSTATADDPFAGPPLAFDTPSAPPGFPVERKTTLLERELDRAVDKNAVVKSGPPAAQLNEARSRLFALDDQLRAMLDEGPGFWNLEAMEQSYRDLQASATPGIAGMIGTRLNAIEGRKRIKAEYDAFVAITSRTDQRDAELLSLQNTSMTGIPVGSSAVRLGVPQPLETQPGPPAATLGPPSAAASPSPPSTNGGATPPPVPPSEVDLNQLDGAGIISRLPIPRPGVPQHILVAPDGRLLAYLQADRGVNLDAHLGQSVGVIGRRTQEQRLRSDLIIVQKLTPVQLQP